MQRRTVIKALLGAAAMASAPHQPHVVKPRPPKTRSKKSDGYDVAVVGAGVFGLWTAHYLNLKGQRVAVIDGAGPASSTASSGGEARVTRAGYGDQSLYSEWAWRSLSEWQALSDQLTLPIFDRLGVLWLHKDGDPFVNETKKILVSMNLPSRLMSSRALAEAYPIIRVEPDDAAMLEPRGGALMARRALHAFAQLLKNRGVDFISVNATPITKDMARFGALDGLKLADGPPLRAGRYVFAAGPWLGKLCPDAIGGRLKVTRQEVYFFKADRSLTDPLPVWADLPYYGMPSIEGRGFKVADNDYGAPMNPDTADRRPTDALIEKARAFLEKRFPLIAQAPLIESRVCQYTNTLDGHFILDKHPYFDNVWLAGGGSGHGFKHGPAIGNYVAGLLDDSTMPLGKFTLNRLPANPDEPVR